MATVAIDTKAEADQRRKRAVALLNDAWESLRQAQNEISDVEGPSSCEVYERIADTYSEVSKLRDKAKGMRVTGIFGS